MPFGFGTHLAPHFPGRFRAHFVIVQAQLRPAVLVRSAVEGALVHRRAGWCGDVASPREASEPVLSLADCRCPRVQAGLLTGGSGATMRSLRSPTLPRNGLLAIFFP